MESRDLPSAKSEKLNRYGIKGIISWYVLITLSFLVLILSSGKLDWINAWVFYGLSLIYQTIDITYLLRKNPQILNERGKMIKEGTKTFDKIFVGFYLILTLISMYMIGLDERLYAWSDLPFLTLYIGIALTLPGFIIAFWAMISNPFFELTARIQKDRNHKIIKAGPYQIIRHPGYAGEILMLLATPLILGSLLGFLPIIAMVVLFIARTGLEDRILKQELSGYSEYINEVKYRLIPYVW
mgnify:CR=1 FL=1